MQDGQPPRAWSSCLLVAASKPERISETSDTMTWFLYFFFMIGDVGMHGPVDRCDEICVRSDPAGTNGMMKGVAMVFWCFADLHWCLCALAGFVSSCFASLHTIPTLMIPQFRCVA